MGDDDSSGIVDGPGAAGVEMQLRRLGGFVGGVDPGEVHELAATGLGVEALAVASFGDLEGSVDEDLYELAVVEQVAGQLALGPERGDERRPGR